MDGENIQKGLEQDAQVVKERIPMSLTHQKASQIAKSLKEFMAERDWSQNKVARMLDVSPTQLNQFLNNKYKGKLDELCNKAVNLINSISRRDKRVRSQPFIETSIAKKIGTLITQTEAFSDDNEGKIGIIIGDAGHGKSHCLRQYAEANKNTVYLELDNAMTPTLMFSEIAGKIGIDSSGSLATITRRLIEHLENRHIIIMLDEASWLKVRHLDLIRRVLVDKSRCPVILAGNRDLLKTVMQPTTRKGYESLDQFTSRLMCILDLDKIASDKHGGVYTVADIKKLYEYGGIRLTNDAINTLQRIAKTPKSGRLRTCSHIIAALHISPELDETKSINTSLVIDAIEQLDLPVRVRLPLTTKESEEQEEQTAVVKAG